jgi:DNA-binding NarL/FixJ family response regulator
MAIIKYAIADDHKIFRQGLRYALADDHKLKFVGEAENGLLLLELVEKQKPDVILLDLKMPEMDGVEATKKIRATYPGIKILMLTTYDDEQFIIHLLELGANGYLLKNAEPDEIKKAIHSAYETDYYFNDLVSKTMLKTITQKNMINLGTKGAVKLNDRETEVLKLICLELTNTEIAEKIFLSPRTVEGIRTTLIEKTGVRNTAGLVLYALKNGIIT